PTVPALPVLLAPSLHDALPISAIEFGLGIAGPLGRGDDLVRRGERVRGVLGAPQHVVPGGQRGGEGRGGGVPFGIAGCRFARVLDRKSTRLNSSHQIISYAVFC